MDRNCTNRAMLALASNRKTTTHWTFLLRLFLLFILISISSRRLTPFHQLLQIFYSLTSFSKLLPLINSAPSLPNRDYISKFLIYWELNDGYLLFRNERSSAVRAGFHLLKKLASSFFIITRVLKLMHHLPSAFLVSSSSLSSLSSVIHTATTLYCLHLHFFAFCFL